MVDRTKKVGRNIKWGIISKIISLILSFASRTVFIYYLGKEYLGINGLYSEILNMLSLVELGFGSAFTFAMYKPVSENDEQKLIQILGLYRKIYRVIALIVAIIGIALVPALQFIVKGADSLSLFNLRLYFLIFLANTVINYFVSYKFTLVNAKMDDYITTRVDMVVNFATSTIQIVVIILFKNYLAYLLVNTGLLMASRIFISLYLNHKYPILKVKTKDKLPDEDKKKIYTEVKGLAFHQFSNVAIHSTDNIIISSLSGLGVVGVGLISNYNTLINSVLAFVLILFNMLTSGFGSLVASQDENRYREVFKEANFINFWIYGFCSIAFFVLIPPFITLWIGSDFLVDNISFLLIIINVYLQGQSTIYNNARIAKGNFNKDKWLSFTQAIINIVVSIVGAKFLGLIGVYIGTIVSRLFFVIGRPLVTYKFLFGRSSLDYYKEFFLYFALVVISGGLTYFISTFILKEVTILTFIFACLVVVAIPNLIFLLVFIKSRNLRKVFTRIKQILKINRRKTDEQNTVS